MSAPVSSWIWLIILPLGPMTSPILSTGILTVMIRGAFGDISSGVSIASIITSRMWRRASRACFSAAARTEAGMPSSLVSSWRAVTNSFVPATLKSMSPKASSAPRMSVSVDVVRLAVDLLGDQAHGDTGDGGLQRHTGVQQRHGGGADRAHGRRAVGAEGLGHLTDRVRELLARRQDRHDGALGERAVADLAALRGADAAGLAGGVRREVVVVHVALAGHRGEGVQLLLHAEHVEGGDAQDLGLATLEQRASRAPAGWPRPRRRAYGCP